MSVVKSGRRKEIDTQPLASIKSSFPAIPAVRIPLELFHSGFIDDLVARDLRVLQMTRLTKRHLFSTLPRQSSRHACISLRSKVWSVLQQVVFDG